MAAKDEEKQDAVKKETTAKAPAKKAAAEKPVAEKKAPAKKAAAEKPAAEKAPAKKAAAKPAAEKKAPAQAAAEKPAAAKKAPAKKATDEAKAPAATASVAKKAPAKKAEETKSEPVLKVHHLRPAEGAKKDRTRVGRGEASKGKTAGRGTKGTKARNKVKPFIEGGGVNYVMRLPKLRGFKNPFRVEYQVVNLEKLAELYPKGGEVTVADLVAKGAVRKNELVKILGNGDIGVKLNVAVDKVSSSAEQKIVAAGGTIQ